MRITTFLLLVCIFCSFASTSHSQNMRVSISKSSTQLNKIFSEIEKQTEYLFVYNNQIDVNRKVSVKVKDKQVTQVLDELFRDTNIDYMIQGNHIVLSSKENNIIAQQQQQGSRRISGVVIDGHGEPVIGANVLVKGTTIGNMTDVDGKFSFEVPDNAMLVVSYIGYLSQEISTRNKSILKITLQEDTQNIDEIVVVGTVR